MTAQYGSDAISPPSLIIEYTAGTAVASFSAAAVAAGMTVGHAARRILPLDDGSVQVTMAYGAQRTLTAIRGVPIEGQFVALGAATDVDVQVSW